jgi:hypothetical protein
MNKKLLIYMAAGRVVCTGGEQGEVGTAQTRPFENFIK